MSDRTDGRAPEEQPRPREYEGEGITVTFEPRRCLHAAECVHVLPEVFPESFPDRVERGRNGSGLPGRRSRRAR
ncbi:(4Fe-4S)-binding protein [Streptomyces sp. bgisy082]|uniref:(4Fe-4S)-binding protein n=1 Tax=Streptomyces sp. bgisy082 TaxID=3413776 RepID=UPI003D70AB66